MRPHPAVVVLTLVLTLVLTVAAASLGHPTTARAHPPAAQHQDARSVPHAPAAHAPMPGHPTICQGPSLELPIQLPMLQLPTQHASTRMTGQCPSQHNCQCPTRTRWTNLWQRPTAAACCNEVAAVAAQLWGKNFEQRIQERLQSCQECASPVITNPRSFAHCGARLRSMRM